jgi:hypothetical protein
VSVLCCQPSCWWLEQEKQRLVLWISALLDEIGVEQKLVKIRPQPDPGKA